MIQNEIKDLSNKIIDEYINQKELYLNLGESMTSLIKSLILNKGLEIHSINFRVKNQKSLSRKIAEKDKYQSINDITDILGIRIITYYSDDVDAMEKIIREQFCIDEDNTVDKRKKDSPDRFGYMSLHYIVSINEARESLVEYEQFKNIRFEIQIRTILQHTWAEIEHDLGYKTKDSVPEHIRRKFSILSGCLELVDSQFLEIKGKLDEYDKETKDEVKSRKIYKNDTIEIDSISVRNYVLKSQRFDIFYRRYLKYAAYQQGCNESELQYRYVDINKRDEQIDYSGIVKLLRFMGVKKIKDVAKIIATMTKDKALIPAIYKLTSEPPPVIGDKCEHPVYIKYLFFIFVIYAYGLKEEGSDYFQNVVQYPAIKRLERVYLS